VHTHKCTHRSATCRRVDALTGEKTTASARERLPKQNKRERVRECEIGRETAEQKRESSEN